MAITLDGTNGITTETGTGDVSVGDDLIFTGTGNRITGDFSNATFANRVAFQTSTVNGQTPVNAIPNGTSTFSGFVAHNSSDPANASRIRIATETTFVGLYSDITGTGTYLPMLFLTGGSERMRVDTSGNLLVGTTSNTSTLGCAVRNAFDSSTIISLGKNNGAGSGLFIDFNFGGAQRGYINWNGSNLLYTNLSDYRLKENIAPMTGALATVAQLKPCTYTWKENGSAGQGFIAHELQAVVPDCVTGEKDAVNEDGSIKPQGVDTSFLVATLTAAIQELKAQNDALEARIAALEGAQA